MGEKCTICSSVKAGVCSSYKDYLATSKGEKRKEMMWIHHFVILQLFHPKFRNEKDVCFEHEDSTLFLCNITLDETQQYINLYHDSPCYEWLWLGRNYWDVNRFLLCESDWYCIASWYLCQNNNEICSVENKSLKMNYHMCFNIAHGTKHVLHELIY